MVGSVMNMKVLIFEVKPLFYSYKTPNVYQVKPSNMFLPPSVLIGAIYKNYVKEVLGSYSRDTLLKFLRLVEYTGFAVLPKDGEDFVSLKKFAVLLKHWRFEDKLRSDAMLREYVYIYAKLIGVIAYKELDDDALARAVESIVYLGNSESMVSVRLLESVVPTKDIEKCRDGYVMQIVSENIDDLPHRGIVELCGKVPKIPWGERRATDICYVWNPVEPVDEDVYRPIRYSNIEMQEDMHRKAVCIESKTLNTRLVFTSAGFECLKKV